jgi:hypothetical protein
MTVSRVRMPSLPLTKGKGCPGNPCLFFSVTCAIIGFEVELTRSERAMREETEEAQPQVAIPGRQIRNLCSSRVQPRPDAPGSESAGFALDDGWIAELLWRQGSPWLWSVNALLTSSL